MPINNFLCLCGRRCCSGSLHQEHHFS